MTRSPGTMRMASHHTTEAFLAAIYAAAARLIQPGQSGTVYAITAPQGLGPAQVVTPLWPCVEYTLCADTIDSFTTIIVECASDRGAVWRKVFIPSSYAETTIVDADDE